MKKVLIAFTLAVAAFPVLAGIDDPAKPWSYFVHPVTCIGMPLQTARTGIQVTPEGTVFTGEHELALFFGDERKPLACRQRRFVDDMPIVEDEWRDGDCQYRWTLFGATLPCDARNDNTAGSMPRYCAAIVASPDTGRGSAARCRRFPRRS